MSSSRKTTTAISISRTSRLRIFAMPRMCCDEALADQETCKRRRSAIRTEQHRQHRRRAEPDRTSRRRVQFRLWRFWPRDARADDLVLLLSRESDRRETLRRRAQSVAASPRFQVVFLCRLTRTHRELLDHREISQPISY